MSYFQNCSFCNADLRGVESVSSRNVAICEDCMKIANAAFARRRDLEHLQYKRKA